MTKNLYYFFITHTGKQGDLNARNTNGLCFYFNLQLRFFRSGQLNYEQAKYVLFSGYEHPKM
jgi:hypothetical protein